MLMLMMMMMMMMMKDDHNFCQGGSLGKDRGDNEEDEDVE